MLKTKEQISLVLPIGKFSFFAHACIKNIADTCGVSLDSFDVVLLTSKTVPPLLKEAIDDVTKKWNVRTIAAPFDAGSNHLKYLDWCVREGGLNEWIIVQHCDYFWIENNWFQKINYKIQSKPNLFALAPKGHSHFSYEGKPIINLHDFFGVYKKSTLISNNWKFNWGHIYELDFSKKVLENIRDKKILWRNLNRSKLGVHEMHMLHDWIDGSELITLEAASHCPERVDYIDIDSVHLWDIFRISDGCYIKNNKLLLKSTSDHMVHKNFRTFFGRYSWFSSFKFEKEEIKNCAVPWSVLVKFSSILNYTKDELNNIQDHLIKGLTDFEFQKEVIGEDDMGIDIIEFKDVCYFSPDMSTSTSSKTPNSITQPVPSMTSVAGIFKSLKQL